MLMVKKRKETLRIREGLWSHFAEMGRAVLDLECSSKALWAFLTLMLLGGGGTFKGMADGSFQGAVACPLRELWNTSLLSLIPGHKESAFAPIHTPAMMPCLATGPKAIGGMDYGRHSKLWAQTSLCKLVFQAPVTVTKGWPHREGW